MKYRVRLARQADEDIDEFFAWARDFGDAFADRHFTRLERVLFVSLAERPLGRSWFFLTGPPYRARLFEVGRRTSYWIVYRIDERAGVVRVLRFWHASRDPVSFRP